MTIISGLGRGQEAGPAHCENVGLRVVPGRKGKVHVLVHLRLIAGRALEGGDREKYSALRPGLPSGVDSAVPAPEHIQRRKLVPGLKVTSASGNCLRMPSSAVTWLVTACRCNCPAAPAPDRPADRPPRCFFTLRLQRQHAVVLQQHHGFARDLQRQLAVRFDVDQPNRGSARIVTIAGGSNRPSLMRAVNRRLSDYVERLSRSQALLHRIDIAVVVGVIGAFGREVGAVVVHAVLERNRGGFGHRSG